MAPVLLVVWTSGAFMSGRLRRLLYPRGFTMPEIQNPIRVGALVTVTTPNGSVSHLGTIEFISEDELEAIFKSSTDNNAYRMKWPNANSHAWFWEVGNGAVNVVEEI
jgi:hypothetical protein